MELVVKVIPVDKILCGIGLFFCFLFYFLEQHLAGLIVGLSCVLLSAIIILTKSVFLFCSNFPSLQDLQDEDDDPS